MIGLVEGAQRQKTPNEIALNVLLAGMTIMFVFATATIPSFAHYAGGTDPDRGGGGALRDADPDDHRRAALRHRHCRNGPSGPLQCARHVGPLGRGGRRRRYAVARQDRHHHARQPSGDRVPAADRRGSAGAGRCGSARLVSDETPEGRSIVVLAKQKYGLRGREMAPLHAHFVPFTAQTRMSGVDIEGSSIRKGAVEAILAHVGQDPPSTVRCPGVAPVRPPIPWRRAAADPAARELTGIAERIAQVRRHALGGRSRWPAAGRGPSQGHRQGRYPRALWRAAARWASAP